VIEEISSALDFLKKGGLIEINTGDRLSATKLGSVLSSSGFSAKSIIDIHEKSREHTPSNALEWFHFSLGLPEWRETCGNYFIRDISALSVFQRLNDLSGGELERSEYLAARLSPREDKKPDIRGFEILFVLEWISGRPVRELETCFNKGSGGLRQDALTLCWIIKTIARVLEIDSDSREENRSLAREFIKLATGLKHGLPEEKLRLAEALNIDREFINRLFEIGITCPRDFENTDYTLLENILPRGILDVAWHRIKNLQSKTSRDMPGISDRSDHESPFTGKHRRLRRELKIHGISVFLQPKLYSYFRKLWWGAKSGNPWIHKDSLEPGINQSKYISKLRRELRSNKIDVRIISDGAGNYRMLLPEGENSAVVAGGD
jgi:hypothetical protein